MRAASRIATPLRPRRLAASGLRSSASCPRPCISASSPLCGPGRHRAGLSRRLAYAGRIIMDTPRDCPCNAAVASLLSTAVCLMPSCTSPSTQMSTSTEKLVLPDYLRPPVVETVLGVQFDKITGINNPLLACFWKSLPESSWPRANDAPPLMDLREEAPPPPPLGIGQLVRVEEPAPRRLQICHDDGTRMIQVQNTRLHVNWIKKKGQQYPRYSVVRDLLIETTETFCRFLGEQKLPRPVPNQWEVTYVNHIPRGTVWEDAGAIPFFKPLNPQPTSNPLISLESFGGQWHYSLPDRRGRLHVEWLHATPHNSDSSVGEVIQLTMTARGPASSKSTGFESIFSDLDYGHDILVHAFADLVSDAANSYWGLNQ